MPLFFLVSGFLSYKVIDMNLKESYFSFFKSKFYRLVVPFLTISFISNFMMIILKYLLNEPVTISSLIDIIKTVILYPEDGIMGALWFLYTLFIISIISPLITKLSMKTTLVLALLLNILVPQYKNFLSVSRISFFLIYFLIGLYFRKYHFNNKKMNIKDMHTFKKVIICIISLICILYYSYITANQIHISRYISSTLNFLCGLFGMILIVMFIEKISNLKMCVKILSFLGRYSLDIYLLSWFFQIASMLLINKMLKITNYNIFFISNIVVGSLCIPFSIYILRRFKILKLLFLGGNSENNYAMKALNFNS